MVVHAQRLTKVFKDFWMRDQVRAVDALDFKIYQGEIFGLIGPNGSGKSTTIKMMLGLLHKTSGRLAVFGRPPTDIVVKKRIGYLPEESYLYPFLNSRETLEFYAKLFGLARRVRQRRIDELLDMVGLDAVASRPIGQFSKGMQRRIGIAQALINDPDFLILDEPTSGLDPIGIRQVKDLIDELGQRGKTILLSSHLLSEVEDVCDRVTILYGGRQRAEGTCDELLTRHNRTIIETDALSPEDAEKVAKSLESVANTHVHKIAPARQSLESLFLDIVERAQAERVATHGARAGGGTAAFLRGDDSSDTADADKSGEDLIAALVEDDKAVKPAKIEDGAAADTKKDSGPDSSVLDDLMGDKPTPAKGAAAAKSASASTRKDSSPPADDPKVDRGLIDSLLDPDDESGPASS